MFCLTQVDDQPACSSRTVPSDTYDRNGRVKASRTWPSWRGKFRLTPVDSQSRRTTRIRKHMAWSFFPNSVDRLFCSLRNTDVARSDIQLARVQRLLLVALMVVLVAACGGGGGTVAVVDSRPATNSGDTPSVLQSVVAPTRAIDSPVSYTHLTLPTILLV